MEQNPSGAQAQDSYPIQGNPVPKLILSLLNWLVVILPPGLKPIATSLERTLLTADLPEYDPRWSALAGIISDLLNDLRVAGNVTDDNFDRVRMVAEHRMSSALRALNLQERI